MGCQHRVDSRREYIRGATLPEGMTRHESPIQRRYFTRQGHSQIPLTVYGIISAELIISIEVWVSRPVRTEPAPVLALFAGNHVIRLFSGSITGMNFSVNRCASKHRDDIYYVCTENGSAVNRKQTYAGGTRVRGSIGIIPQLRVRRSGRQRQIISASAAVRLHRHPW